MALGGRSDFVAIWDKSSRSVGRNSPSPKGWQRRSETKGVRPECVRTWKSGRTSFGSILRITSPAGRGRPGLHGALRRRRPRGRAGRRRPRADAAREEAPPVVPAPDRPHALTTARLAFPETLAAGRDSSSGGGGYTVQPRFRVWLPGEIRSTALRAPFDCAQGKQPAEGIEPTAAALQKRCSTVELRWRRWVYSTAWAAGRQGAERSSRNQAGLCGSVGQGADGPRCGRGTPASSARFN